MWEEIMDQIKKAIAQRWREFALDQKRALARLGLKSSYGLLVAATVLPIMQAYSAEKSVVLLALGAMVGDLGANLLSNLVQEVFDKSLTPSQLESLAAKDQAIRESLDLLISQTESLRSAQEALGPAWEAFAKEVHSRLRILGNSPRTIAILEGHSFRDTAIAAPVNIIVNPGGTLNIQGSFLNQVYGQIPLDKTPTARIVDFKSPAQKVKGKKQLVRGSSLYSLNLLDTVEKLKKELGRWRFISTSARQPIGAVANGLIGLGQNDGVTFALSPMYPIDNVSVECELQIGDDGGNDENWAGIRVRAFDFCYDFRLGYLIYLRSKGTVELYGPQGIIDGSKHRVVEASKQQWTTIRVDVYGSEIKVMVNGNLHIRKTSKTFGNEGLIFLHTYGTHALFRRFEVYRLTRETVINE
jgi:hypothetical protein